MLFAFPRFRLGFPTHRSAKVPFARRGEWSNLPKGSKARPALEPATIISLIVGVSRLFISWVLRYDKFEEKSFLSCFPVDFFFFLLFLPNCFLTSFVPYLSWLDGWTNEDGWTKEEGRCILVGYYNFKLIISTGSKTKTIGARAAGLGANWMEGHKILYTFRTTDTINSPPLLTTYGTPSLVLSCLTTPYFPTNFRKSSPGKGSPKEWP